MQLLYYYGSIVVYIILESMKKRNLLKDVAVSTYITENLSIQSNYLQYTRGVTKNYFYNFLITIVVILTGFYFLSLDILSYIVSFVYSYTILGKLYLFNIGKKITHYVDNTIHHTPIYTIILPIFRDKEVIKQLLSTIANINYPKDKLQVLLVLEEIDYDSINYIKTLALPFYFRKIIVPDIMPRTKAKACNYALQYVVGDYLCIFDADDIIDPDQLQIALTKFQQNPDIVCLQAKLNYYNSEENFLTRLFAIEYQILFDRMLPAIAKLHLPIPLGGSSNHFNVKILKDIQGWDIYNLTEDAEIGLKLAELGYRVDTLNSYTFEEAPITIKSWLKQRSRWIKGYLQTYIVYCVNLTEFAKNLNCQSIILFHYMIGFGVLSSIFTPLMLCKGLLSTQTINIIPLLVIFIIWFICEFYYAYSITKVFKKAIYFPIYFILHSISGIIAIFDLIIRPFYWSKTKHGETSMKQSN